MKVNRLSATQSQFVLERNDILTHEIGAADWIGRVMLARHFMRVAWLILRRGRVRHSIEGGQSEVLEDILDAEVIGE